MRRDAISHIMSYGLGLWYQLLCGISCYVVSAVMWYAQLAAERSGTDVTVSVIDDLINFKLLLDQSTS